MTAEVVSLRRARKAKARGAAEAKAAANRMAYGRTKAEKEAETAEAGRRERALDGARREP
ncbi:MULTISPECIES: DUF4169 family protein [unclassified Sphingomonas]|uniref:DUF4169 family protein n=1 Tax=unclassified Sphingomonas TaxID=196159 RepID=UPI00226AF1A8|nr:MULTISPECIES: DUF4169 family protein [unclassified Sphingomonas]